LHDSDHPSTWQLASSIFFATTGSLAWADSD
jgi:hypothetical protein